MRNKVVVRHYGSMVKHGSSLNHVRHCRQCTFAVPYFFNRFLVLVKRTLFMIATLDVCPFHSGSVLRLWSPASSLTLRRMLRSSSEHLSSSISTVPGDPGGSRQFQDSEVSIVMGYPQQWLVFVRENSI